MSKAAKGIGKVFKKAAPVLVPLAITAATGGFGAPAVAGLTTSQSLALTGPLGMMGGGAAGAAGVATAAGMSAVTSQAMSMGSSIFSNLFKGSMTGDTMDVSGGVSNVASGGPAPRPLIADAVNTSTNTGTMSRTVDWIKSNPELTKLVGGLVGGAADAYSDSLDRDEKARQFDESRRFSGAFYGIGNLPPRRRKEFF